MIDWQESLSQARHAVFRALVMMEDARAEGEAGSLTAEEGDRLYRQAERELDAAAGALREAHSLAAKRLAGRHVHE